MSRNMYLHTFDILLISSCYQNKINEWGGRGKGKREKKGKEKKFCRDPGLFRVHANPPDLNQGPSDLQSDALPTELSRQPCEIRCKFKYLDVSIVDDCSVKHYLSVVSNISILIPYFAKIVNEWSYTSAQICTRGVPAGLGRVWELHTLLIQYM